MFAQRFTSIVSRRYVSTVVDLYKGLINGDRGCLAKCITLVESTHKEKQQNAKELLSQVLQELKQRQQKQSNKPISFRIGLSGSPGAGKSTFINVFGRFLIQQGHKVAVLTVDPSSSTSGGSILGDKTRMLDLSRESDAYIRTSPSAGTLGGVTRTTNDAIVLCEAAGYNVILVETVGVGQSEFAVVDMVDMFCVLLPPGSGDELQGMKKGIMELVDLVIVTKADGELMPEVRRLQTEWLSALRLMRRRSPNWKPKVISVSARTNTGIDKSWEQMFEFENAMIKSGEFMTKRSNQLQKWMWNNVKDRILEQFLADDDIQKAIQSYEQRVIRGLITPFVAADAILALFAKVKTDKTT
ncbi:unnamed protein product [Rotaria sordida]|uniref:Methylmalonic aciduria type A protein, mitochondrial n=2 Tax=Rotaria sordida TaxID=392033 RepID=A0A814EI45_9BILA|nr:unnamed protein product [Rotaria sordida]CAF0968002.1 unnamed protein product [Rotaria sordida]